MKPTAMTSTVQAVFFFIAVVLFLATAARSFAPKIKARIELAALGAAFFVFVFAWQAWAAK